MVTKEKLNSLPNEPGVYKMLNESGMIVYIGKSKCLKKRVKSYFVKSPKWEKVKKMTPFIHDLEYEVTDTHLEAMLLECDLIKKVRPYFNVLMKYDDRYFYVLVSTEPGKKPLSLVYQREKNAFGPFRSKGMVMEAIDAFQNFYPMFREGRRFQFDYHIFPESMEEESYLENSSTLLQLFKNPKSMERFIKEAEKKMKECAKEYKYEMASTYRDFVQRLSYIHKGLFLYQYWKDKMLYLDLEIKGGHKMFFIGQGHILLTQIINQITENDKEQFIAKGKEQYALHKKEPEQKGSIDYWDIIYGELMGLSREQYEIYDGNGHIAEY